MSDVSRRAFLGGVGAVAGSALVPATTKASWGLWGMSSDMSAEMMAVYALRQENRLVDNCVRTDLMMLLHKARVGFVPPLECTLHGRIVLWQEGIDHMAQAFATHARDKHRLGLHTIVAMRALEGKEGMLTVVDGLIDKLADENSHLAGMAWDKQMFDGLGGVISQVRSESRCRLTDCGERPAGWEAPEKPYDAAARVAYYSQAIKEVYADGIEYSPRYEPMMTRLAQSLENVTTALYDDPRIRLMAGREGVPTVGQVDDTRVEVREFLRQWKQKEGATKAMLDPTPEIGR